MGNPHSRNHLPELTSTLLKNLLLLSALLFPLQLATASFHGWTDSQCLASAIHYEARGEPLAGRRAVLDTITNRMLATGKSACGVVLQRGQFSWSKSKPLLEYNSKQKKILSETLKHPRVLINENHTYFYSGSKPYWAHDMTCKRIYNQTFCRGK